MIGQIVSHYKIIEKLGEGGMGVVYKASDIRLKRQVALKFLPPELTKDPEAKHRFLREAEATSLLDHPNICTVYEIDETADGQVFIAMPFYEGQTLKDRIYGGAKPGPLEFPELLDISLQIASGLARAHEAGIIHRDIKSANVCLTRHGEAKILDFGLAKLKGRTQLTQTRLAMGTVTHMSPEQARGEEVDQRSDIWSLGVVMYEMATGQAPFRGDYDQAIIYSLINEEPDSVAALNPKIPKEFEPIIKKALAKDRAKRFQNVSELIDELQRIEELHVKKNKTGKASIIGKKHLIFTWRSATAIFLLSLIILMAYFLTRPPRLPSLAVLSFKNATGDNKFDKWKMALLGGLIANLNQSRLIRVINDDRMIDILQKFNFQNKESYTKTDLKKIATKASADHILQGSILKSENTLYVETNLTEMNSETMIDLPRVEGSGEGSFPDIIENLTNEIKRALKLTRKQRDMDKGKKFVEISTPYPEAWDFYIRGEQLFNRREYAQSIDAFNRAIEIDPNFLLAYWKIYINYSYWGYPEKENEFLIKTINLLKTQSGRISSRDKLLIEAHISWNLHNSCEEAIAKYRELLNQYPHDEEGQILLGVLYRNNEEWDSAYSLFKELFKSNPHAEYVLQNLILVNNSMNSYADSLEIIQNNPDLFEKKDEYYQLLAQIYCAQGQFENALEKSKEAIHLEPGDYTNTELLGNIYQLQGKMEAAENEYQNLIEQKDINAQIRGRMEKTNLYIQQGEYQEALKEVQQGLAIAQRENRLYDEYDLLIIQAYINLQSHRFAEAFSNSQAAEKKIAASNFLQGQLIALHLQGIAQANLGNWPETQKIESRLGDLLNKSGSRKWLRELYHLQGVINKLKHQYEQAIIKFENAFSLLPSQKDSNDMHAFFLDDLASTKYQKGDWDQALKEYEKIMNLNWGRLNTGDIYAKSYYWAGKIYQQKKLYNEATNYFKKFIKLLEKGDPNIKEKEDALKQLQILNKINSAAD